MSDQLIAAATDEEIAAWRGAEPFPEYVMTYGSGTRQIVKLILRVEEQKADLAHIRHEAGPDSCADYAIRNRELTAEVERLKATNWWRDPDVDPPPSGVPVVAFFINPCGVPRLIRAEYAAKHTLHLALGAEGDCGCGEDGCGEDDLWCAEGWYESNEFEEIHWKVTEEVLLWHSLPELPVEYRKAERSE